MTTIAENLQAVTARVARAARAAGRHPEAVTLLAVSKTHPAERVREAKEAVKTENTLRNFAGLASPLADTMRARLDPELVAELEADALARQRERDQAAAARRAAKEAASPPAPAPLTAPKGPPPGRMTGARRGQIEVLQRRPAANGGPR